MSVFGVRLLLRGSCGDGGEGQLTADRRRGLTSPVTLGATGSGSKIWSPKKASAAHRARERRALLSSSPHVRASPRAPRSMHLIGRPPGPRDKCPAPPLGQPPKPQVAALTRDHRARRHSAVVASSARMTGRRAAGPCARAPRFARPGRAGGRSRPAAA